MKKIVLGMCVFLLTMGLAMSASASLTYSTTGYYAENIGSTWFDDNKWDKLTIAAQGNTTLDVSNVPATFDLQSLTFRIGLNTNAGWITPEYIASWDMTVGSVTKTIGQKYYADISTTDTLYLLSAVSQYFDLGSGESLKVDLQSQFFTNDSDGHIKATLQVVPTPTPIPAAVWLLGSGLAGLLGLRRRFTC